MKVIGCLGRKGGSGKTMVAHLLAHGLSKGYGIFTNLVMTDVREGMPINFTEGRDYFISSITNKNPEQDTKEMEKIVEFTSKVDDSILIIDGGANRANVDAAFAAICDMVLIPAGTSTEDLQVAESDYWGMIDMVQKEDTGTDVFIIRNRWPGVQKRREALLKRDWVREFMLKAERSGMLFPDFVPDMPSLQDMANADDPKSSPLIDSVATRFAEVVALRMGIELPERRKLVQYNVEDQKSKEESGKEIASPTTEVLNHEDNYRTA